MRAFSRILQIILLGLAAFILIIGLIAGKHIVGALIISVALVLLSTILGIGIDPTLKNPTARKYFRVAIYGIIFVGIPFMVISLIVALLNGEKREAVRTSAYLILVAVPLYRYRHKIASKLVDSERTSNNA